MATITTKFDIGDKLVWATSGDIQDTVSLIKVIPESISVCEGEIMYHYDGVEAPESECILFNPSNYPDRIAELLEKEFEDEN